MPKVKLLKPVTYMGATVEAGETIEIAERSAQSLVADGIAEAIDQEAENGTQDDENGEGGTNTLTDEQKAQEAAAAEAQAEELAKVMKAIDDKFKRDELATAAKDMGVEFAYDAKKAEIIEAVVAAGKAEALLQA